MSQTISVQNVGGINSNIGFFFEGFHPNDTNIYTGPLNVVQIGWYAQGPGVSDAQVININPSSELITIEPSQQFQSGRFYYFTQTNIMCFKEDTKILCLEEGIDTYIPIQNIQKGQLVKTLCNGYLKADMIGKGSIYNSGDKERGKDRLYKCSKENYKELTEDLIITGAHSILVNPLTEKQADKTKEVLGQLYVTDKKYRLMAFIDERAEPYDVQGTFTIYHIALEDKDEGINFGIYANGLLVETCSKKYLRKMITV